MATPRTTPEPETITLLRAGLALPERPKVCDEATHDPRSPCSDGGKATHAHTARLFGKEALTGKCTAHACSQCVELPRLASEPSDALAAEIARMRECLLAILDVADPDGAVAVLAKAGLA